MREGLPEARVARPDELPAAAGLLDRFQREYDCPTPGAEAIAARLAELGDTVVLLSGDGPDGVAVVRRRGSIFSTTDEAYLAELYVVPERRRRGLGHALMDAVMRLPGLDYLHLQTSDDDREACALYERCGMIRTEGPGGPPMRAYEIEL